MNENGVRSHAVVLVHQADAVITRDAKDTRVGRDRYTQLLSHVERRLLGKFFISQYVKGHLEAQHVVIGAESTAVELFELRSDRPLPGGGLDVAVEIGRAHV